MSKRLFLASVLCAGILSSSAATARAERLETIAKKLITIDAEVTTLGQGIRRPNQIGKASTTDIVNRRLINAQVNFGIGNYDDAAVQLYDFVEKYPSHRSWDEALYYLAESLFQKGDYLASKSYFIQLIKERGTQSKFYQQSLERLIELTLKLDNDENVSEWIEALDNVPQQEMRASVPYVRGKYSYFLEKFDESLKHFAKVPRSAKFYVQAQYFIGVNYVAKGDIALAMDTYRKLLALDVKTKEEKRVLELSHMAMGRLYYEREQPSKSVDSYLRISRHSDLFDEALFEVTWVYVKNKEFNKALRALELLSLTDPTSVRMPDVRILEGNLRIRKAKEIAENGRGNSKEQYDKATVVFTKTGSTFRQSHKKLKEILLNRENAANFLAQISGRNSSTFDVESTMPEVAAAWLRQQPEVERVISVESNLGQIEDEIANAERTIVRLESALNTSSKVNIFPFLAQKSFRSTEILEQVLGLKGDLVKKEQSIAKQYASSGQKEELRTLRRTRQNIEQELAELPDSGENESARIGLARNRYTELQERAAEVSTFIGMTEAQLVALEKFVKDQSGSIKSEEKVTIEQELIATRADVNAMRADLAMILSDSVLAKDRAGTGDEVSQKRVTLRADLQKSYAKEHTYIYGLSSRMSSSDAAKIQQITMLTIQSDKLVSKLDTIDSKINTIVDGALGEVLSSIASEKASLGAYKQEFINYESESHGLGGEVLTLSFKSVTDKFYDILARTDVGIVDVAWSLKEASETMLKRLNLDQARERKNLDSDFADISRIERDTVIESLFDQAAGKE